MNDHDREGTPLYGLTLLLLAALALFYGFCLTAAAYSVYLVLR